MISRGIYSIVALPEVINLSLYIGLKEPILLGFQRRVLSLVLVIKLLLLSLLLFRRLLSEILFRRVLLLPLVIGRLLPSLELDIEA